MKEFRVIIDVKDVAGGDVDMLAEAIMQTHGDDYDASKGDFTVSVFQKQGENYFRRDEGDDDL